MEQKFQPKWIPDKECWRLVHPQTGDFIAEFYPDTLQLAVTKHRKTDLIDLKTLGKDGNTLISIIPMYGDTKNDNVYLSSTKLQLRFNNE